MKTLKTIKVLNAWNISGTGIIIEAKNIYNGIPKGTILKSQETNFVWIVESRIVETLALNLITRFSNETETSIHLNFKSVLDMEKAKEKIIEKNQNRIFQYHIKPMEHNEKPSIGQTLTFD